MLVLVLGVGKVIATLCFLSRSKEQIAKDLLSGEEEEETQSSADDLTPSVTSHEASDLFHNQSGCRCHGPFPIVSVCHIGAHTWPGLGGFAGEMPRWPWVGCLDRVRQKWIRAWQSRDGGLRLS